jgi:hypothetical protein
MVFHPDDEAALPKRTSGSDFSQTILDINGSLQALEMA